MFDNYNIVAPACLELFGHLFHRIRTKDRMIGHEHQVPHIYSAVNVAVEHYMPYIVELYDTPESSVFLTNRKNIAVCK